MASGEPWGCALIFCQCGNFVVIKWYSMHWGIMGYVWGMYGYVWLWWPQLESVVNPQGSAQLMISVEICPPGAFDLEAAKPGLHGMWATTLPKFQSYGSWVTTVLRCHPIPYPITSTMGTTWPIWCDGRSVFRCRWTILWLITPITPIYGYLCGMLRISTHSTRPVPNWTRGPCETAPWWLLRCGLQCRGRRTSSGRHHGMISKYTLW
jgi:hypothetical protein